MASISSVVKDVIYNSPFISEMLIQDVISFSNLAKSIKPRVEALYGKSVNNAAIVMSIRRYADDLKRTKRIPTHGKIDYELTMKSNIYDVNFLRNDEFIKKLPNLYDAVRPEAGDFLSISFSSYEISLAVSEKHKDIVDKLTEGEKIVTKLSNLVALTIVFSDDKFLQTPGVMYLATRMLAWENINVFEIVSTMNVLTFVVSKEDGIRAYAALQTFLNEKI